MDFGVGRAFLSPELDDDAGDDGTRKQFGRLVAEYEMPIQRFHLSIPVGAVTRQAQQQSATHR